MTIPKPLGLDSNEILEPPRMVPNDNTDGRDPTACECGHAQASHHQVKSPDPDQQTWRCDLCTCTRAVSAWVPSR